MAGGNLFGRALSYVVNEFIVEGLANSRAFQRFAVKTNRTLESLSSKAKEVREELSEQIKDARGQNDVSEITSSGEAGVRTLVHQDDADRAIFP
ncbi:uncharacterized protein LOC112900297 isoform X1 [Panicum hallii]|uniref:uncharacterized protein LOC112900297 isoform X1 n=1 Tax=Panicum hallii TaxID=206008 RepID=UPI000DF4DAA0|nr:uncharacterized protein LOC112900297 isoform X1 [Panicum hallii]